MHNLSLLFVLRCRAPGLVLSFVALDVARNARAVADVEEFDEVMLTEGHSDILDMG